MTGAPFGAFAPLDHRLGLSELRLHAIEFAPWRDQSDIVEKWLSEEERRTRLAAIRKHIRRHDLSRWIDAQLSDLDRASTMRQR